jgi:transposase
MSHTEISTFQDTGSRGESTMNATTVAIDLAKDVFELAFADAQFRIVDRKRVRRRMLAALFENRAALHIVMEACGSAHYWARRFERLGHRVTLLPAHDVRPYVRRNKTDRTDAAGMLEALRCGQIRAVPIKSPCQQSVQALHRIREQLKASRTATINLIRGLLREFGITIPAGAAKVRAAVEAALEDADNELAIGLRIALAGQLAQIAANERAIAEIDAELQRFADTDLRSQRHQQAGGVGLITATAISASVGALVRFPSGRHFASWLGLSPREHSSGGKRQLGRISKQGDVYLRTLLTHGARSLLNSARRARTKGQPLDLLRQWAVELADRIGTNKATIALANKLARRLWAAEHHGTRFNPNHLSTRTTA